MIFRNCFSRKPCFRNQRTQANVFRPLYLRQPHAYQNPVFPRQVYNVADRSNRGKGNQFFFQLFIGNTKAFQQEQGKAVGNSCGAEQREGIRTVFLFWVNHSVSHWQDVLPFFPLSGKPRLMVVQYNDRHALLLCQGNFLQGRNPVIAGKKYLCAICRQSFHSFQIQAIALLLAVGHIKKHIPAAARDCLGEYRNAHHTVHVIIAIYYNAPLFVNSIRNQFQPFRHALHLHRVRKRFPPAIQEIQRVFSGGKPAVCQHACRCLPHAQLPRHLLCIYFTALQQPAFHVFPPRFLLS